jgi:phytoene dehydrogenase-like protein
VKTETEVTSIDVNQKIAYHKNDAYPYDALLWCGDLNHMYQGIKNTDLLYQDTKEKLLKAKGNDSLYQMYISVDLDKDFYKDKCSGHIFYMPQKVGLSSLNHTPQALINHLKSLSPEKRIDALNDWLIAFAKTTTYEISIPILRDETLAPKGKSSVIISTLFDYDLTLWLSENNLYKNFKKSLNEAIIHILNDTLLNGWSNKIISVIEATPLTIKSRLNNTGGAITGWSFHGDIPVESKLFKIARSIQTPFPYIYQSSQWSFSPSGFPTSIVTAKIAANKIDKLKLKNKI